MLVRYHNVAGARLCSKPKGDEAEQFGGCRVNARLQVGSLQPIIQDHPAIECDAPVAVTRLAPCPRREQAFPHTRSAIAAFAMARPGLCRAALRLLRARTERRPTSQPSSASGGYRSAPDSIAENKAEQASQRNAEQGLQRREVMNRRRLWQQANGWSF